MSLAERRRDRTADPDAAVPGRRLTAKDFRRLSGLVRDWAGISLPESKMALVQTRLTKRLRALGIASFHEYCVLVEGHGEAALDERQEFISAITTNVTQFFREPHHFEDLRTRTLPPLIERAVRGGRVRIWSAGCSTGEEPYSLALTVLTLLPDAGRYDIRILATDLDRAVLATASRGVYPDRLMASVPAALKKAHFQSLHDDADEICWSVGEAPRQLIAFRTLNLTRSWPMKGGFDVIFCRNVVIYFDSDTETAVWKAFSEFLNVGGRLFVGHSERLNTLALPMFESDGVTTYRKV